MRKTIPFNNNWIFTKENTRTNIDLPHTWNAKDGQDGGNDYWRGTAVYTKQFEKPVLHEGERLIIEFNAAAMRADVSLNGLQITSHEGGYSIFRADLTDALLDENELTVSVDNGKNDRIYPQKADFTFYGGIYRDVNLIIVPAEHFELIKDGTPGIRVTPSVSLENRCASVTVETWQNADSVTYHLNNETRTVPSVNGYAKAEFVIDNVHLWNGVKDPFLYTVKASLESGDEISTRFGCRTIAFDSEKGFILNGNVTRLCGAARHQDREGIGNAINKGDMEEDMAIMREMGANTVRLAHYQHDQYFYDLCDQYGLTVWAEIPYITEHLEHGEENALSQMKELITQCYNHPSIICWGLSNEITASGGVSDEIIETHKKLNDLCHRMDSTRPTTMANVFMLSPDDEFVFLPDIRSYNLYYGWYIGDREQNDEWFDNFHKNHPDAVIGLSEYGADASPQYQNAKPEKGDWTEGYQALYHEHMLKMWSERPYIWAMHCWNMFDFGADGRDEGGKPGQNQKGLVTFDRKIKKDAFYIYRAYLSDVPFIHICGKRYTDRTEDETEIRIYSNLKEITLSVDGKDAETKSGDKVFVFRVPISGEHFICASNGNTADSIIIRHVSEANPDYVKPGTQVTNWFDREDEIVKPGFFSIKDSMADLKANTEAKAVMDELTAPLMANAAEAYGDVAKNVQMPPEVQAMMDRMSVEATLKQMGGLVTPEFVHKLNAALNKVRK